MSFITTAGVGVSVMLAVVMFIVFVVSPLLRLVFGKPYTHYPNVDDPQLFPNLRFIGEFFLYIYGVIAVAGLFVLAMWVIGRVAMLLL